MPCEEERATYRSFNLLTSKPVLYAANVREDELSSGNAAVERLRAVIAAEGEPAELVIFSAKVEAELAELPFEDRGAFLDSLGVHESGLDRLATAGPLAPALVDDLATAIAALHVQAEVSGDPRGAARMA